LRSEKILITGSIPGTGISRLRQKYRSVHVYTGQAPIDSKLLMKQSRDIDGLLCMVTDKIDRKFLQGSLRLKAISLCGTGYDNIDVAECTRREIPVSRTPGVLTEACADLTMGLVLAVARRIPESECFLRAGKFRGLRPDLFLGCELTGKTLGIVGYGKIGKAVARRARPFGMKIVTAGRSKAEFQKLLHVSDIVSIHCPLNSKTRHLFDASAFSKMKRGAFLINTARGPVVNERALVHVLRSGRLGGAGLDVYESEPRVARELLRMKNVVLVPHIASATVETRTRMADMAVTQLDAMLRGDFSRVHRVSST
jgi:glyoxylate reductase